MRGKEGAGLASGSAKTSARPDPVNVSVPLRGKEGAGQESTVSGVIHSERFPSPCGVRRVRDIVSIEVNEDSLEVTCSFRPLAG